MNDSVHVRLLSDISDKVTEAQSVNTEEEDSLWEFGSWKEAEGMRKAKTNSESQGFGTKRRVETRVRSFSKIDRKVRQVTERERPWNTPFLLFPMSHTPLQPHLSPIQPATTRQTSRPKPISKKLSLHSMMIKQVRQVISITSAPQPIHSGKIRPFLSNVCEKRPSFPRVISRKVVRRAESKQEGLLDRNSILFL